MKDNTWQLLNKYHNHPREGEREKEETTQQTMASKIICEKERNQDVAKGKLHSYKQKHKVMFKFQSKK